MKNHFSIGLVAGLVGGATYGLLTAKRSGQETRVRLKDYSEDVQQESEVFKHDLEEVITSVRHIQEVGLPLAQEFGDDVQAIASDFQTEAQPRLRRIQERVDAIEDSAQDFQETTNE